MTFSGPTFRVYTSDDVIGVELGGTLKNIIAVAAGILDGMEEQGPESFVFEMGPGNGGYINIFAAMARLTQQLGATALDQELKAPDLELNQLVSIQDVTARVEKAVDPQIGETHHLATTLIAHPRRLDGLVHALDKPTAGGFRH